MTRHTSGETKSVQKGLSFISDALGSDEQGQKNSKREPLISASTSDTQGNRN